jgi:hypothetical protein
MTPWGVLHTHAQAPRQEARHLPYATFALLLWRAPGHTPPLRGGHRRGSALHVMLLLENPIWTLFIFNVLQSRDCQRALFGYHYHNKSKMTKHDTTVPSILHVVYTKSTGAGFTKWTSRPFSCDRNCSLLEGRYGRHGGAGVAGGRQTQIEQVRVDHLADTGEIAALRQSMSPALIAHNVLFHAKRLR